MLDKIKYFEIGGVRMSHKSGLAPMNFYEYTVYSLESVWDISEKQGRIIPEI
jgi:hypothetical protein